MFPWSSTSIPVGVTRSGFSASRVSFTPGISVSMRGGRSAGTSGALGGAEDGAATAPRGRSRKGRRRNRVIPPCSRNFTVPGLVFCAMGRTRGRARFHPSRGATAGLFNNREVRGHLPKLSLGRCLWSYQIGNHECPPESTNEKSCEQPFGMRVSVRHPSTNPSLILIENPKLRDE